MRIALIVSIAVALAACAAAAPGPNTSLTLAAMDGIELTTERQSYAPGEEVTLTLRNQTEHELGHNLCSDSVLERREGGQWVEQSLEPRDPCPALLGLMPPGGSAAHAFLLHSSFPEGEYRFRTTLEHMDTGERRAHPSGTFRISR